MVKLTRAYRPPQPMMAKISAVGIKKLTGGDDSDFIYTPIISKKNLVSSE
jgi:hypothetical protein